MTFEENFVAHNKAKDIIDYLGLAFHITSSANLENYILTNIFYDKNIQKNIKGKYTLTLISYNKDLPLLHLTLQLHVLTSAKTTTSIYLRAPPDYRLT